MLFRSGTTLALGQDAEFHAAAESVRPGLEPSPAPVEEPESTPAPEGRPIEPSAPATEPAPQVDTLPGWRRALSLVRTRPRLWGGGALASVSIRLTPGSELFIDGSSKGITQEDTRVVGNLKAMLHTFRAEKGRQFQPSQKALELSAGRTADLDLRLTVSPVPVDIKKLPPDSSVTYTRAPDKTVRPFAGTHQDLPEGDYTFTADAKGYLQKVAMEHISWDSGRTIDLTQAAAPPSYKMADWGNGVWMEKTGYSVRDGSGYVLFPNPLGYVQFTVCWQGGKTPAQWLLRYVSEKDYIKCEIGDDGFQAVRVSETKSPEVLASKKGLPKSPWYEIHISLRSDGATISLQTGPKSELLGEVAEPGFAGTRFGFYVQNGQHLYLANFFGRSFR